MQTLFQEITVYEWVSIAFQLIGFPLVIIGLFYTARQIKLNKVIHQENLRWNKIVLTEQVIANKLDPVILDSLQREFGDFINEGLKVIPLEVIQASIAAKPDLRKSLHKYLNWYERIARGYNYDIYDKKIVANSIRFIGVKVFHNYKEYIECRRALHSQTLWVEFELFYNEFKEDFALAHSPVHNPEDMHP